MLKRSVVIKLKGLLFAWVLRLQRLTWRVSIEGRENLDRLYRKERPFLLCFWHGKYVPIFPLLEGYQACVLSSISERGDVIAEICRNFGYTSAQITDQPKPDALRHMKDMLSEVQAVATAMDGPLGPYHRVKYGTVWMAAKSGFVLLPLSVGSRRKIVLNKRWDRMELPLPFTQVCLVFGKPISVPESFHHEQIRELTDCLAKTITDLDDKAERIALGTED